MINEELAILIQSGLEDLLPALWEQCRRLISKYAWVFYGLHNGQCASCGVTIDDLTQEGYFAMLQAVKAFEPERGYKFLTYIKYPLQTHFNALIGLRTRQVQPLNVCRSLDMPIGKSGDMVFGDLIPDKEAGNTFDEIEFCDFYDVLYKSINKLSPQYRDIIHKRFFQNKTFKECAGANSWQLARERERNALRKLRGDTTIRKTYHEYYSFGIRHIGVKTFKSTHTSSTEAAVMLLEEIRNRRKREETIPSKRTVILADEFERRRRNIMRYVE